MSRSKIEFEESSGNVFADLGIDNAEELQARAMIGFHVVEIVNGKEMKQREVAQLLGIKQAEVSHLLNGHFSRFTVDKLLDFLKCLNQKVSIQITPHKQGEPFQHVAIGL
jgi:predicted XRE-type DNA-binding protein